MLNEKELWLMRSGKGFSAGPREDVERSLKRSSKLSAQRVGAWMNLLELSPDMVISSPAERARATATKAAKVMGIGLDHISIEPALYDGGLPELIGLINELPEQYSRVLLVGHKKQLKALLKYLEKTSVKLSCGILVRLSLKKGWQHLTADCCSEIKTMDPMILPDRFPFIEDGKWEYRNRPAYYYSQSAILPYRIRQGRAEVMIVSSSNNKHWLIPKGIIEPGMTAQESACKEAYEEAGVIGEVEDYIGSYTHKKWGSKCTVSVYSMRVTDTLPSDALLEPHRQRQWLPIEQACKQLQSKGLKKLLRDSHLFQTGQAEKASSK